MAVWTSLKIVVIIDILNGLNRTRCESVSNEKKAVARRLTLEKVPRGHHIKV